MTVRTWVPAPRVPTTIERYVRLLKELTKHGDLRDPESVKVALTRTGWADGTKEMACGAYAMYAKRHGFTFVPPPSGSGNERGTRAVITQILGKFESCEIMYSRSSSFLEYVNMSCFASCVNRFSICVETL